MRTDFRNEREMKMKKEYVEELITTRFNKIADWSSKIEIGKAKRGERFHSFTERDERYCEAQLAKHYAEFEELINEFLTPTEIKKWRNNLVKLRKEIDDSNESYYKRIYIEM